MAEDIPIIAPQTPSIKLIKGLKGIYSWEIRVLDLDIEKLKALDARLKEEFGNNGN